MSMNEYKGVMVFAEQREGVIEKVAFELLGKGREIADKINDKLTAVLVGENITCEMAQELVAFGADRVIKVSNNAYKHYITEPYTKAVTAVIKAEKPEIVFVGATTIGRDLAPRVSARLHTGLTADCTVLDIDEENGSLLMTRPAFGGNILATIICPNHRPQMSTVRPGVMLSIEKDLNRKGEIIDFELEITAEDMNVEILEVVKEKKVKKNIEEAGVLVSGGRGIGKAENMQPLHDLAEELGGLVSGSRAIVDNGWVDATEQVGQTGKTVRPEVYFALGISGAIQHVAGMEESEFVVAINSNPTAPIFDVADLGLVGDANKIVPLLLAKVKELKNA